MRQHAASCIMDTRYVAITTGRHNLARSCRRKTTSTHRLCRFWDMSVGQERAVRTTQKLPCNQQKPACGKYLSYAANHNTKSRKLVHRTVSTITCKHTCSAPVFSTLRRWRYDESHAIPKASETLDLRTAQTRRDPSSKKARAESNIPTHPPPPHILQGRGGGKSKMLTQGFASR